MPARIPLVHGAAVFGAPKTTVARIHTLPEAQENVDVFIGAGYTDFDASNLYGNGTCEEYLAKLDLKGGRVDTKIFPFSPGDHSPERLRAAVKTSAAKLAPNKINVLYLHKPDRSVPYEDTLREIDALHKEGLFTEFGVSNYPAWEVAEIVGIARSHGWIAPTVYQGRYNALERTIEKELIPCLRKYGIRFYAFSPLAGGLLAGRAFSVEDMDSLKGSRWDTSITPLASFMRGMYTPLFPVFSELKTALGAHNIGLSEAALRWIEHHSILGPQDRVIVGASNAKQLAENIRCLEEGPLPDNIIAIFDSAWAKAMPLAVYYAQ